jgi:C-terminal processing protease CtpA/Prc
VRLASAFLERVETVYVDKAGTKIVYNMTGAVKRYENSGSPERDNTETISPWAAWRGSVTVLVGGRTESIGETFTALLQRDNRAMVIGSRTAGGGGVLANRFPLQDGASLQLTTHFILDGDGQRLPMHVDPDIDEPLDLTLLTKGRDSQLERALR